MGGSYGGSLFGTDIKTLENKVKQRLAEAKNDAKRHIFISFDNEDMDEVNLLRGQAKNDKFDLQFDDHSVKEPYNGTQHRLFKEADSRKNKLLFSNNGLSYGQVSF